MIDIPRHECQLPDRKREARDVRMFLTSVTLAVAICLSAVYLGMAIRDRSMIYGILLTQARSYHENIVTLQKWYDLYVDDSREDGLVAKDANEAGAEEYGKNHHNRVSKNPAEITRELSSITRESDNKFTYHIVSLRPIGAGNRADAHETTALKAFGNDVTEMHWSQRIDGDNYFRYMAPLYVKERCLACHRSQGYRVGDVLGGISVSFTINEIERAQRKNLYTIIILAVITIALLLGLIYHFFNRLHKKLSDAQQLLTALAAMDELTNVFNRRHVLQRLDEEMHQHRRNGCPLSCTMLDVDFFKSVNDRYGHLAGDAALKHVAQTIKDSLRMSDIVGRYGGEEFLIILPETGRQKALDIAERIRLIVAETSVIPCLEGDGLRVTVSLGVTSLEETDTIDSLISRADSALYRAKDAGRNRTEVIDTIEMTVGNDNLCP
ncbi:MAG: diguanylate cyclase [Armatimonadota bacterium]